MRRLRHLLWLLLLGWGAAAHAQVEIAFYSKDMASTFPHAYVRLTGTDDSTGEAVDSNYGFTPVKLTPGVLFGPVRGAVESVGPAYIARSDRHFSLKLTDAQYRRVLAVVESYRNARQPSYRLNGRNCVTFVADVAMALGLSAPVVPRLMKKPKSYLQMVSQTNAALIASWPQRIAKAAQAAPPQQAAATTH